MSAHDELDRADDVAPAPAAPGSPLASIRERRKQALAKKHLDLEVPDLEPPLYVRFKALEHKRIVAINKRHEKSKDNDKAVIVNAAVLAEACVGIFEVIDGEQVSIDPSDRHGEWPRFDERLADLLDVEATKASDLVRELYLTDGHIISTGARLMDFSGYDAEALAEFTGN